MEQGKEKKTAKLELTAQENQWKAGYNQLRREWALSRKGVIVGLKYCNNSQFSAKVRYLKKTKNGQPSDDTGSKEYIGYIYMSYEDIKDYFPARVIQHVYDCGRNPVAKGFYDVPLEFVKADSLPRIQDYHIKSIKYVPSTEKKVTKKLKTLKSGMSRFKTSSVVLPAKFIGKNEKGETVKIDNYEWVRTNFGIQFEKELIERQKSDFVPIPVGKSRISRLEEHPWLRLSRPPLSEFVQDDRDMCLFYSAASALHYLGYNEAAATLAGEGDRFIGSAMSLEVVREKIHRNMPKWLQSRKIKPNFVYSEMQERNFAVVVLQGTKGSVNHGITIVDDMIFDSNEPEAIRLSHAALSYCVDPEHQEKFKQFARGWVFYEQGKKQRMKKMKRNW